MDWTNVVTAHLRKQLQDIALPSAPRAGVNIKQTFKGVLADPEMREKWISRFSYWYVPDHQVKVSLVELICPSV